MPDVEITINRAPVLMRWTAVVAERPGFDWDEVMAIGRAVAGLEAYANGKASGFLHRRSKQSTERRGELEQGAKLHVDLLRRAVSAGTRGRGAAGVLDVEGVSGPA